MRTSLPGALATAVLLVHSYNVLPDARTFIHEHVPMAMRRVSELMDEGKIDTAKAILSMLEINRAAVMARIDETNPFYA